MCSVLTFRGSGPQLPERLQTWDGGAALRHPRHSHRQPDPVPCNRRHWPYKTRAGPFSISVSFYSRFPHLPATPAECESAGCFLRWVLFILCQLARWRESNNDVWAVLGWLSLMDLQGAWVESEARAGPAPDTTGPDSRAFWQHPEIRVCLQFDLRWKKKKQLERPLSLHMSGLKGI